MWMAVAQEEKVNQPAVPPSRPPARPDPLAAAALSAAGLLEQLPVAACVVDEGGRVVAWNRAAEEATGVAAAVAVGADYWPAGARLTEEEGRPLDPAAGPLAAALAGGRPRRMWLTLAGEDGEPRPIAMRTARLHDPDGRAVGAIALFDEDDPGRWAMIDPATGVATRRVLVDRLQVALGEFDRYMSPSGVVLVEADEMDTLAARHGPDAAAAVLRAVADALAASARPTDLVGRWEGDTFLVLLREVDAGDLGRVAERLRSLVSAAEVGAPAGALRATASFGATLTVADDIPETLVERARTALDQARAAGGDRVVTVEAPPVPRPPGWSPSPPEARRLDQALRHLARDASSEEG